MKFQKNRTEHSTRFVSSVGVKIKFCSTYKICCNLLPMFSLTHQTLLFHTFQVNGKSETGRFEQLGWQVIPSTGSGGGNKFVRQDDAKPHCYLEVNFDGKHKATIKIRKSIGHLAYGKSLKSGCFLVYLLFCMKRWIFYSVTKGDKTRK